MNPTNPDNLPFNLEIPEENGVQSILNCQDSLRARSGKRLTCKRLWENQPVVIKLFSCTLRNRWHWDREVKGLRALTERGIKSPKLLYIGRLNKPDIYLVVTEFIPSSITVRQELDSTQEPARQTKLLKKMIFLAANHHRAGILHCDPHLSNFLLVSDDIVTVDGGDIDVRKKGLSKSLSFRHLAELLAEFPAHKDRECIDLLDEYLKIRGWNRQADDDRQLYQRIRTEREIRRRNFLAKTFRDCTAFVYMRTFWRRTICLRNEYSGEVKRLLEEPQEFLEKTSTQVIKNGNTATVFLVPMDNRQLVIKRYNIKSRWHALGRAFRRTRASISWYNAHALIFDGFATARPIALVENRLGPLASGAYLVMEYLNGPNCIDYFSDKELDEAHKKAMAAKMARMLRKFAVLRIGHGDLKGTNIIIVNEQPNIVDLDAMLKYKSKRLFQRAYKRDLKRFFKNWQTMPEIEKIFRSELE